MAQGLYPVPFVIKSYSKHTIPPVRWPDLIEASRGRSLRSVARDFGVSHETVRLTLTKTLERNPLIPHGNAEVEKARSG
jgi:hypothetical protein